MMMMMMMGKVVSRVVLHNQPCVLTPSTTILNPVRRQSA
jgi:hypothetical protein